MYRILKHKLIPALVIGAFAAVHAFALPILVTNASFETLPLGGLPLTCGVGCSFSVGAIPGWTNSGVSGQFQPVGGGVTFNSIPDGVTVAYSNDVGGVISQTVLPTVMLGVIYTLQVDLGARNDGPQTASADLFINGNLINALGVTPTPGNFSTFTATYTGLAADVGSAITIQLRSNGFQGDFDNVRLVDSSVVPEPATATIFALGLAGVLAYARRRRLV